MSPASFHQHLLTPRLRLVPLEEEHGPLLLRYALENRDWLAPWEAARPQTYFTLEAQQALIAHYRRAREQQVGVLYGVFWSQEELIGRLGVSDLAPADSAVLGYSIARHLGGKGLGTEAVRAVTAWGFQAWGLCRMEMFIHPLNQASLRLARRAGFQPGGVSNDWVEINGRVEKLLRYVVESNARSREGANDSPARTQAQFIQESP
ncbi:MAG: GNAT family N-acetyltransferase [Deltaproteobacteria bacterium]|nr:GNAT family N-acetyltransferase [Deltaproteobacteria bacterium]